MAGSRREFSGWRRERRDPERIRAKRLLTIVGIVLVVAGPVMFCAAVSMTESENERVRRANALPDIEEIVERQKRGQPIHDSVEPDHGSARMLAGAGGVVFFLGLTLIGTAHAPRRVSEPKDAVRRARNLPDVEKALVKAVDESMHERPETMSTADKTWTCPNCDCEYSLHAKNCPRCGMHRRDARRIYSGRYEIPEIELPEGGGG
jgi:hypothetical protein